MERPRNPHFPSISELIMSIDDCPLVKSGVVPVHPVGSCSSGLMLIGEAPGAKEDETGEPFVGRSGQMLNEVLLGGIGLTREDVYITNIVKCRPPENRDPTDAEKSIWKRVLVQEIKTVKPKIVATLGRHSLSFFLPKPKISELHGNVVNINSKTMGEFVLMPLYHPAASLYNPKMKDVLIADFEKVGRLLRD